MQPTRAALISGQYLQRYAVENALGSEGTFGLKVTGQSVPQLMKNAGYATALVGKWHLGGTVTGENRVGGPRAHGFDYFFGMMGSHSDFWWHNRGPKVADLWENETRINRDGRTPPPSTPSSRSALSSRACRRGGPFTST